MKVRIWSILVILCMAVCLSCSDDEPKTSSENVTTPTEDGDEKPGDDNTGDDNTGDDNTGDDNTGDDNTGDEKDTPDAEGQINWPGVYKIWVHENGMNILDFQSKYPKVYQLEAPGSDKCNYFDYGDYGPLSNYGADGEFINFYDDEWLHFWGYVSDFVWCVKEVTSEKLVLQPIRCDFEDVYYAASKDILPKVDWSGEDPFDALYGMALRHHAPWGVGGPY